MERFLILLVATCCVALVGQRLLRGQKKNTVVQKNQNTQALVHEMAINQKRPVQSSKSLEYALDVVTRKSEKPIAKPAEEKIQTTEEHMGRIENIGGQWSEFKESAGKILPLLGKDANVDREVYQSSLKLIDSFLHDNPEASSIEVQRKVQLAMNIVVSANPDSAATASDLAWLLKDADNPQVRQVVIDSFAIYNNGNAMIEKAILDRATN